MWDQRPLCRVLNFLSDHARPALFHPPSHTHSFHSLTPCEIYRFFGIDINLPIPPVYHQDRISLPIISPSYPFLPFHTRPRPAYQQNQATVNCSIHRFHSSKPPSFLFGSAPTLFSRASSDRHLVDPSHYTTSVCQPTVSPVPQSRHPALPKLVTAALLRLTHHHVDPYETLSARTLKSVGKRRERSTVHVQAPPQCAAMLCDAMRR